MSPNAMGNANAQQIAQLEEMKKKIDEKAEVHGRVVDCLVQSKAQVGQLPEGGIAGSLYNLAEAQLILADYSLSELKAQSILLDEAIAKAKSPIATATIHPRHGLSLP